MDIWNSKRNVIFVRSADGTQPDTKEGLAAGTTKPGHLVDIDLTSSTPVGLEGATTSGLLAIADIDPASTIEDFRGNTPQIDIAYAANETVYYRVLRPGDVVQARVSAAVAKGDKLVSAASGQVVTSGSPAAGVRTLKALEAQTTVDGLVLAEVQA